MKPARLGLLLLTLGSLWLTACSSQAPDEPFVLIDGRRLGAEDLRNGPVLLNFWATSCSTCMLEIPDLVALHTDYADQGLTVIGVAMPYDPPHLVVDFARSRKLPYAIALDIEGKQARAYGDVRLTPTNILIRPDGYIVDRHTGRLDLARARQQIEQLIGGR